MSFAAFFDSAGGGAADGLAQLIWRASWQAAVLAGLVLVVHLVIGRRISPRWRHAMWMLVLVRLALPVVPRSPLSVFNLTPSARVELTVERQGTPTEPPADVSASAPPVAGSNSVAIEAEGRSEVLANTRMLDSVGGQSATVAPSTEAAPRPAIGAKAAGETSRWRHVLVAVWIAGVLLLATRVAWATIGLSRMLRRLERVEDPDVLALLASTASELNIRRPPTLLTGDPLFNPALVGFVRPRVLIPRELLDRFDHAELRLVFLHELGHLKRRDVATNWFATFVTILHWPNPIAWLAAWRLRVERELACDEVVLSRTAGGQSDRRAYGETILKLLESCTRDAATAGRSPLVSAGGAVGILEGKQQMKRRIIMIARFAKRPRTWAAVAASLVLILAVATLTDRVSAEPGAPASAPADRPSDGADERKVEGGRKSDKSSYVYISGSIKRPGAYMLPPSGESLAELIAAAGGVSGPPQGAGVQVLRKTKPGGPETTTWFAADAQEKQAAFAMAAGDQVMVKLAGEVAGSAPATQPDEFAIAVGDLVQVTVYDLEGPGKQTIKNSRVNAAGEITLPYMNDGVKVAGLGEAGAQKTIAEAYKIARVLDNGRASIVVLERRASDAQSKPTAGAAIVVGELVTVSIMDLVGAGVETVKTSRVDGDGNINLPYIGLVKATGLRSLELEKAIAKAYTDKGVLNRPLIVVSLAGRGESHVLSARTAPAPSSAATSPAPSGATGSEAIVRIYDVADMMEMKEGGPGLDMSVLDQLMEVVKLAASPSARVTKFDTKLIVSGSASDQKAVKELLDSLYNSRPSTRAAAAKAHAEALKRAEKLWREQYLPRVLRVAGETNLEQIRDEFAKELEKAGEGDLATEVLERWTAEQTDSKPANRVNR